MAEGGMQQDSFKDSFSKGSGDECVCDPCINGGKCIIEIKGYCIICQEYLCGNCLEVHKNQRMTRHHTILDSTDMPKGQVTANQDLCVEVCKTHYPEIVRFFCKVHDVPGCVDCMTLHHATCKKDRVQDISGGFQATIEFKLIQQNLDKFIVDLGVMKDSLQDDLKKMDTAFDNIQQKITDFRKQIDDYLDQMQKQITEEADNLKNDYEREMKTLIEESEAMIDELKGTIQKLQTDSDFNVNTIFVTTKNAKQRLVTMETEMKLMKQTQKEQQKKQQYVFQPSTQIEDMVSDRLPLGKLSKSTTASFRRRINVKSRDDKRQCKVTDCTLLSPDKMVVADGSNNKVKLIDLSNTSILSSYSTSNEPSKVTATSINQVAVLIPNDYTGKIQLLSITSNGAFTEQHSIPIHHRCSGLAYKDGKMAVSYVYSNYIDILNMLGEVLHTIQPTVGKLDSPRSPLGNIAFGHDNDPESIIMSDSSVNKVSVVSFEGQILQTYTHDTLKVPSGIVRTPRGGLFICSKGSDSIHVVSPDFMTSRIIISKDNNIERPESITYCSVNHKLYISNTDTKGELMNTIQVYDFNI